jgi:hypothetical protein
MRRGCNPHLEPAHKRWNPLFLFYPYTLMG